MVELVLVVCLLAAPDRCREERPVSEPYTAMECVLHGQVEAARWVAANPRYKLLRWRCGRAGPREEPV